MVGGLFFWWWKQEEGTVVYSTKSEREETMPIQSGMPVLSPESALSGLAEEEREMQSVSIIQTVPFTVQAPTGKWTDSVFQDGCEEASVLMASQRGRDGIIDVDEATKEIIALSQLSKRLFGTTVDTSAEDTLTLYRHFTGRKDAGMVLDPATGEAMQSALAEGSILIVPVNGQALGNPHFTAPGPETHMLVVIGYDTETQEYITHDPGTRHGSRYRYAEERLWKSMRDYPTGDHILATAVKKRAIVIEK